MEHPSWLLLGGTQKYVVFSIFSVFSFLLRVPALRNQNVLLSQATISTTSLTVLANAHTQMNQVVLEKGSKFYNTSFCFHLLNSVLYITCLHSVLFSSVLYIFFLHNVFFFQSYSCPYVNISEQKHFFLIIFQFQNDNLMFLLFYNVSFQSSVAASGIKLHLTFCEQLTHTVWCCTKALCIIFVLLSSLICHCCPVKFII